MSTGSFLPAALIFAVAVAACGKTEDSMVPTQAAAKVNGDEISAHQVTHARIRGRDIDQDLLVQKAMEAKLDRDPQVMRSIESAKRQILARAYLEKATEEVVRISPEELGDFYRRNPALFGERRVYRVQELSVAMPRNRMGELEGEVAKAKNLNDVVRWLKAQGLPFHIASATKAAEHVPLSLLQKLTEMKDGEIAVFAAPQGASIVQLVHSQAAPLTEKQARPAIEQFLVNRKRLALAESEVKRLRAAARIKYVGNFEARRPAAATPMATPPITGGNLRIEDQSPEAGGTEVGL